MRWPELEELVAFEFKARARMHLSAPLIPTDEVTWLAQMQHYAVSTRLLDFTYSPFVALYFAIRNSQKELLICQKEPSSACVRLWAVNASAVNNRFWQVTGEEIREARKRAGEEDEIKSLVLANMQRYAEPRECVWAASPPAFNPRLVSQQGLFLINCADSSDFRDSLRKMMEGENEWGKALNMNIHEQSLFPDMEGLAGLIRQKLRLHWK